MRNAEKRRRALALVARTAARVEATKATIQQTQEQIEASRRLLEDNPPVTAADVFVPQSHRDKG
jgi:hypothetical protein